MSESETIPDIPFLDVWPIYLPEKVVLLRDTTSPVPGFETFAED